MRAWRSSPRWSRDRSDKRNRDHLTDPTEVRGLPEDDRDQRSETEWDQNFLRLQTEAQTIHGGGRRERNRGTEEDGPLACLANRLPAC